MGRILFTVILMALWACGGAQTEDSNASLGKKTFPQGYETWSKINAETIFREETEEEEGVAREIYGKLKKDLAKGTILVKADHAYVDGAKGEIRAIAVMRRVGSSSNGGWHRRPIGSVRANVPANESLGLVMLCI